MRNSQETYFGIGKINVLNDYLHENKIKKIFLVSGKKSYIECGAKKILSPILQKYNVKQFSDFSSNPKFTDIEKGVKLFKRQNPDLIIAVGGGSVIDMAKSINVLSTQDNNPKEYVLKNKEILVPGKKMVAIPTTAGTGSESTCFSVVYIGKTKHTLKHQFILPNCSIVDPQFTFKLNKKITAETGADALTQAIESYWSVNSTTQSKVFASTAIALILKNLSKVVNNPDNKSRSEMSRAANLAGRAINISETTACHAISYPITSFFNITHGQAVVLTLGSLLNYNSQVSSSDITDKRGVRYVKTVIKDILKLLNVNNCQKAQKKIESIMVEIGLAIRLHQLKISKKDLKIILDNGFNPERMKNNPRKVTERELRKILVSLL
jgi:alcohol dehydrogenase class IV